MKKSLVLSTCMVVATLSLVSCGGGSNGDNAVSAIPANELQLFGADVSGVVQIVTQGADEVNEASTRNDQTIASLNLVPVEDREAN